MNNLKHKNNKAFFILLSVAILTLGSVAAYAFISTLQNDNTMNQLNEEEATNKKNYIENTDENGQPLAPNNETSNENNKASFTLSDNGTEIVVITKIEGFTEGTCTLSVDNYTASAPVLYQPQYSTCEGFTIDKSEINDLSSEFILNIKSGDKNITIKSTLNG